MRGAALALSGLFSMMGASAGRAAPSAPAYAIVIGNNASPPEDTTLAPLRFADDDAVRYAELLERVTAKVHLLTVLDAQSQRRHPGLAARTVPPTLAAVRAAVSDVQARLQAQPGELYFVFSGHGSNDADGQPFLALLDEGLTRTVLFEEILGALPATRVHLIVDACNAGAVVGAKGAFDQEVDATPVAADEGARSAVVEARALSRFPHVGAIIATSAGQQSHEWSRIESGVFTHELLSGLVGPADINGDLRIEYSEAQAFVSAANSRVSDPRARPQLLAIPPARDHRAPLFALDRLPGPCLRGDPSALGHFFIELGGGRRYLDAHLGAARPVSILLPPRTGGFLRAAGAEAELPAASDGVLELSELDFKTVRLASRGSLDNALQQDLFAAPFDVAYYRGFVDSQALVPVDLSVQTVAPLSERWTWKEKAALGLAGGALAAAISTGITAGLAVRTRDQFDATTEQRAATDLANRYDSLVAATWVTAAVTAAALGTGLGLWLSARPSEDGRGPGATIGLSGSF